MIIIISMIGVLHALYPDPVLSRNIGSSFTISYATIFYGYSYNDTMSCRSTMQQDAMTQAHCIIVYLWVSTLCSDVVQPLLHPAWIQVSLRKEAVIARETNQWTSPLCRKES